MAPGQDAFEAQLRVGRSAKHARDHPRSASKHNNRGLIDLPSALMPRPCDGRGGLRIGGNCSRV
eukprot:5920933-Pyramimonas_sp.AAC.1